MKVLFIIISIFISTTASASDMAGVGLVLSIPVSLLLFITAFIVALMSSTESAYKYIFSFAAVSALIALVMAKYTWQLEDDIQTYRWHLLFTALMILPPLILKVRLRNNEST